MRILKSIIFFIVLQSCATKKYINKYQVSENINSATEEVYLIKNDIKEFIERRHLVFSKNGRLKTSQTFNAKNKLIEETEKRLWFIKKSFPNKEPYYCKTRWKPKQRERISCYSQKTYKQNEAIYYYNKDGTINKIEDNFTNFKTQYFSYTNKELSKIIIKNKEGIIVEKITVKCIKKDQEGTCTNQLKIYNNTGTKKQTILTPKYK